MSRKYQLTLKIEDKREDVSLSGEIEDDDWEILSSFILYADELLQTNLVRQGMVASSNINWKQDSEMIFTTKLPPWDDVIVFLHRFRPLGLQSENTNFYKVHNLLAKLLPNSNIRSVLAKNREYFSGKKMQSMLRISIDDILVNSEQILFDWLNAYEYHRDKAKKEFIDSLHNLLPLETSKVLFLQLLSDKTQAIFNLADFSKVIIGQQKQIITRVKKE